MPTLEQYQQAIHNAHANNDSEAAAELSKRMQPLLQAEAQKRAAADMGTGERLLANIGAGMTNAWEGAKQVLPVFKASSDAEIREKRSRDQALADATDTGVGADWMPTFGKVAQFAGEAAPTLAIPGFGAGALAAKALPAAASAATRGLVRAMATGAVGGGAAGALQPVTDDESRAVNTVFGAAGGAVLPAAGAAARGAANVWSKMTRAGGTGRAGSVLREALGADADTIATAAERREAARKFQPESVREIPETLSEASGSGRAARIESRARRDDAVADTWQDFVREQNAARWNAVRDATKEGAALESRDAARDRVTGPLREKALAEAGQDPWFHVPAMQAAENVLASPMSANPAVRKVADYVRNQIGENADTAITPARLYEVRKVLADYLHGPRVIGDEFSAAVKAADKATMKLINGIDDSLNAATSARNKWQNYLNRYQDRSRSVDASRAARDARAVFEQPGVGEIGGSPEVTLNRLRQARNAGQSNFDPSASDFSARADRVLQAVEDQMTRAQEPTKVRKLVGTQGGGSISATELEPALRQLAQTGNRGWLGRVADLATKGTQGSDIAMRTELSRLLQNPQDAVKAIRAAAQQGMPLSHAQQILLEAASRASAGAAAAAPLALQQ